MVRPTIRFILFSLFFYLMACTYNEEVAPDDIHCDTDSVTYLGSIVPILQANCYTCHDKNNAPAFAEGIVLEGHDNIKEQVEKGRLLGAIRHQPGFTAMPRNLPRLPECTLQEIEAWVEAGASDN
jgi:hypothetical protein